MRAHKPRAIFTFFLVVFSALTLFGSLVTVQPAHAQALVTTFEDIPRKITEIRESFGQKITQGLLTGVMRVLANFVQRVAYDSAVWLASGAKGQQPFFYLTSWENFRDEIGDAAVGNMIEELGKPFGLNLCKPPNIQVDLAIRLGLQGKYGRPPKPNCTLSQFVKNWENAPDQYRNLYSGDAWLSRLNDSIQPDQSDFGLYLESSAQINNAKVRAETTGLTKRASSKGAMDWTDIISGNVKTPALVIEEEAKAAGPAAQRQVSYSQITNAFSSGAAELVPFTASVFLNTFASQVMNNFFSKGMFFGICANPTKCGSRGGSSDSSVLSYDSAPAIGNQRIAQELYQFLQNSTQIDAVDFDMVQQLASCPDTGRGVYNCAMDNDGLAAAVREADNNRPLTIREAIAKGNLHGSWKLIPPDLKSVDQDQNCYQYHYCYSNLKKLRQARILPLGFEIAAKISPPSNPVTLQTVIDGFAKGDSPYYHLVDPDWVVKAPKYVCRAKDANSSIITPETPNRLPECADVQTCIEMKDGKCVQNTYGYCAREKNVWQFNAPSCPSYFATCQTFTNSKSGQQTSYLERTLDTESCNKDNVGCLAFSTNQDANGNWLLPSYNPNVESYNNGLHLNDAVSYSCSANSAGCSAFIPSSTPDADVLYLRKAPQYFGCYDANPATAAIDWPQDLADLSRIHGSAQCSDYAIACIPEEEGCSLYTPLSPTSKQPYEPSVPGKYNPHTIDASGNVVWNDECAPQCVGYNAYREEPSYYSAGQNLAYIIPASGQSCTADAVGCSGFTNLSTFNNQQEQVEYFSFLRACINPQEKGVTYRRFITYEGSDAQGFQLQTYLLESETDGASNPPSGDTGMAGPKYFYRTGADLVRYQQLCNATTYRNGALVDGTPTPPDCRQFIDEQGKIYYRILAQTIPVSDSCTPYRLNNTELYSLDAATFDPQTGTQSACENTFHGLFRTAADGSNSCNVCFQNGKYENGACTYYGLPGGVVAGGQQSNSCNQSENSCRAYKAPSGNNVAPALTQDTFGVGKGASEDAERQETEKQLANWTANGGTKFRSFESTQPNGRSLGYRGGSSIARTGLVFTNGERYNLAFWAKGDVARVRVELQSIDNPSTNKIVLGEVNVGTGWQNFQLEPVIWDKSATSTSGTLVFYPLGSGQSLFIDNVYLRATNPTDLIFLVKDSLHVDAACDSSPDDNLPGEALGCTAYRKNNNSKDVVNLVNFSYLCREDAVGCTAVYDTYNTLNTKDPEAFNVWLAVDQISANASVKLEAMNGNNALASCVVAPGESGCYVDVMGVTKNQIVSTLTVRKNGGQIIPSVNPRMVTSTTYIPADTQTGSPIFLVSSPSGATSCKAEDLGCMLVGRQRATATTTLFDTVTVKNDPASYQKTLCRSEAVGCEAYSANGSDTYFKNPSIIGAKLCVYKTNQGNPANPMSGWFRDGVSQCRADHSRSCVADSDCAAGDSCDPVACYPDFNQNNLFGIWSYGNKEKYQNYVGACDASANACVELVDHNANDQAYYVIKNDLTQLGPGDCNGNASLRAGCALFDQTDNPQKSYDTKASYSASDAQNGALVPVVTAGNKDANLLVKVQRDRECGEWLQCRTSHQVWNMTKGSYQEICDTIGRCDALPNDAGKSGITSCGNWVDGTHNVANEPLTQTVYAQRGGNADRPLTWADMDFSGYSIFGAYPVEELGQVNVGAEKVPDWRLMKKVICPVGVQGCANANNRISDYQCAVAGTDCGGVVGAKCYNGTCALPGLDVDSAKKYQDVKSLLPNQTCRAYPENDSPFPNTLALESPIGIVAFKNANRCAIASPANDTASANACECSYTRLKVDNLGGKDLFYPYASSTEDLPQQFCTISGVPCQTDNECKLTGGDKCAPAPRRGVGHFIGREGFCLEQDLSLAINADQNQHACLTWLPIDQLSGALDPSTHHPEAGFQPNGQGPFYCIEKSSWEYLKPLTIKVTMGQGNTDGILLDCNGGAQNNGGARKATSDQATDPSFRQTFIDQDQYVNVKDFYNTVFGGCEFHEPDTIFDSKCPANYSADRIRWFFNKTHASPGAGGGTATWDLAQFVYDCLPVKGAGWYPQSDITNQIKNVPNYQVVNGFDENTPSFQGFTAPTEDRCVSMYQYSEAGESKAWTNRVWMNDRNKYVLSNGVPSGQKVVYNDLCNPFGAVGMIQFPDISHQTAVVVTNTPQFSCFNIDQQPVNALSVADNTVVDKFSVRTVYDWVRYNGVGNPAAILHTLDNLFIKTYKLWRIPFENFLQSGSNIDFRYFKSVTDPQGRVAIGPNTYLFSPTDAGPRDLSNSNLAATALDAPQLRGVQDCSSDGQNNQVCKENESSPFTINGYQKGDVVIVSQPAQVDLRFYAFANKDHMPLRSIQVDWGNGTEPFVLNGSFRNNRGELSGGTCKPQNFSASDNRTICFSYYINNRTPVVQLPVKLCTSKNECDNPFSPETACAPTSAASEVVNPDLPKQCSVEIDGIQQSIGRNCTNNSDCSNENNSDKFTQCTPEAQAIDFGHILGKTCDNAFYRYSNVYSCSPNNSHFTTSCPREFANGCCVFTPRVRLKDNWGWYTNGVYQLPDGSAPAAAWVPFAGKVIVAPDTAK